MKDHTPLVSVIVPVYNAREYVEQCLDSLLAQTFKNFEVMLIDDGSTDGSSAICDNYAKKDSRIKAIHQANAGQTSARRNGVRQATGKYIAFVDSDDWVEPDYLETLQSEAEKCKADIVTCDVYYNFPNREVTARQRVPAGVFDKQGLMKDIYPMMIFSGEYFYYGVYAAMWNKLVKRTLVEKNIEHVSADIKIGEDGATTFANFLDANVVSVIHSAPLYHYRINPSSITQSYCPEQFSGAKILAKTLRDISNSRSVYDLNTQIDYYFSHYVRFSFNEEFLYKNAKSLREKIRFLKSIFDDAEVKLVSARLDFAKLSSDARRFYGYMRDRNFTKLIAFTMSVALNQKARRFAHKLLKKY